jgi:chemotaxis protein CheX
MTSELMEAEQATPDNCEQVATTLCEALSATYASICGAAPDPVDDWTPSSEQVVGLISLVGTPPLSLLISLPKDTAVAVSEKFAGFEFEFDSEDMNDLVGELANIIAGDAKSRLLKIGIETTLSLPTVVSGRDVKFNFHEQSGEYRFAYQAEEGPFGFQVVVANAGDLKTRMPGS